MYLDINIFLFSGKDVFSLSNDKEIHLKLDISADTIGLKQILISFK